MITLRKAGSIMRVSKIRKRDGRIREFNGERIRTAIMSAAKAKEENEEELKLWELDSLCFNVVTALEQKATTDTVDVEDVQDEVEKALIKAGHDKIAKRYILYRADRTRKREAKSELMDAVQEIMIETSRDNANVGNSPSAKMLQIASAASKQYYLTKIIPEDIAKAHRECDIHIHDLDYYGKTLNCLQIDLTRLLKDGFNTGYGYIRPPKRIGSATAQAAIVLQSNQNDMFGGQSFPHFDKSMGEIIRRQCPTTTEEEIFQAMEGLVYNLNTMHSRAGSQVPFSSINIGTDTTTEGRMVTKAILKAFSKGLGKGESPIFPNLVFRLKAGINLNKEDVNYDLFQLAMEVAAKRMNPTFSFMDATFNRKFGDEVSYMGCRSRVMANRHGEEKAATRGNIAPVTINLPRLAIKTQNIDTFFNELDNLLELCGRQLMHRFELIAKLKVKDLPFLMGQKLYMGSEKIKPEDEIREAIKNGTLAIGFVGLAEALKALTGKHHGEDDEIWELGYRIIERIDQKTKEFSERYDMNFVGYATPAEGCAGRFAVRDRKDFGDIEGVTTKDYYTNSYHIPVEYEISAFDKIEKEGPFHKLCPAGHISYIEMKESPKDNMLAFEKLLRYMAEHDIGYAGVNFPIDECRSCGYSGILDGNCPDCGSSDIRRIRRITGYLSTVDRFNDAKLSELNHRTKHSL